VTAGLSDRIDKITITESADTTIYDSPPTEIPMGFGQPIDNPALSAITEEGTRLYRDAVILVADALGVELDTIRCEAEFAHTT
jgi:2,4-diaminopentanoate dehydrogenase